MGSSEVGSVCINDSVLLVVSGVADESLIVKLNMDRWRSTAGGTKCFFGFSKSETGTGVPQNV